MFIGPPLLAGLIAALAAVAQMATDKYPQTFFLTWRSRPVLLYALLYFIAGIALRLGLNILTGNKTVQLQGPGVSDKWIQSVIVGFGTKAFWHIRLWSVGAFPIGVETIIAPFEMTLDNWLDLDQFNAVRDWLAPACRSIPTCLA